MYFEHFENFNFVLVQLLSNIEENDPLLLTNTMDFIFERRFFV